MATPHFVRTASLLACATVLLVGCGDDDDGGGSGGTGTGDGSGTGSGDDGGTSGDTGAECTPGTERCPCHNGQCFEGLVCLSDICVTPPEPPPDDSGTGDDGGTDTGTGDGSCSGNEDCRDSEVCFDGTCEDAWGHDYDVRVLEFIPTTCEIDGWGEPEIYYEIYVDHEFAGQSYTTGCPSSWDDNFIRVPAPQVGGFWINFMELDAFSDDYIGGLCWDTFADGTCGPIPKNFLHDGGWAGTFGLQSDYAEVEMMLVQ